jgi:hypothetical protein
VSPDFFELRSNAFSGYPVLFIAYDFVAFSLQRFQIVISQVAIPCKPLLHLHDLGISWYAHTLGKIAFEDEGEHKASDPREKRPSDHLKSTPQSRHYSERPFRANARNTGPKPVSFDRFYIVRALFPHKALAPDELKRTDDS